MTWVMNKAESRLLDILRQETGGRKDGEKCALTAEELEQVMRIAKEHTVLGLVADAAAGGGLEIAPSGDDSRKLLVMKLMQANQKHQRRYKRFEEALGDFARLMQGHGIRYVVFKGVAVARHYAVPHVRSMGDVDFYVPGSDFRRAVEVIERGLHVEIEKEDVDKHYSFDYRGIRFEMHYQIETFGSTRHQRYFNTMVDACIADGADSFALTDVDGGDTRVAVLPPAEDLTVVFKHWFNHLLVEGVGLRQTVDLAVMLQAYRDRTDAARLVAVMDRIGYIKAFRAMLAMMRKHFGVACADSYCALTAKDERRGDALMAAVVESGNFGRKAYKNRTAGKKKSMETATRAFGHCVRFFMLAPTDILCLVPRRIGITLKQKI